MPIELLEEPKGIKITLAGNSSISCQVDLFGATVTSWKVNDKELLFLSTKSARDGSKAVRGGIPVVFPQFAKVEQPNPNHLLPQHGFARSLYWEYLPKLTVEEENSISIHFALDDIMLKNQRSDIYELWSNQFRLEYSITLTKDTLKTIVRVANNDKTKDLVITPLLHTYFKVEDITKTRVHGLQNHDYIDKVQKLNEPLVEKREYIQVNEEIDFIYHGRSDTKITLYPNGLEGSSFSFENISLPDAVVWNPWEKLAKAMGDMGDEDYKNFICVELGQVKVPHVVSPITGSEHIYGQILKYKP